ncbi:angiotensinogen [Scomber scombrus]|uniref:Angiotensinogen n=1 Tax=Scomber scombrus TaxID=13677 RepID=A0AAV1N219_SCOSC|nr:angiotensinogen [Scomber scombrus]XP_062287082.1 angiotensinogen [Scomber scombrus]XP_062287083.1 angiotensinogen [Scomber scombrus]XP_062287084.1 angiotensinogen [Scomber scombrus]
MQRLGLPLLVLLLCCYLSGNEANRVYVHPFYLFAAENVSCETLQTQTAKPLLTGPVAPLDIEVLTPDSRDPLSQDGQRQNITQRTAVLAGLLNSLGLRMYQAFSSKQHRNILLSPVNTFGSLVTFYLGASKKTAGEFQELLGLSSGTDQKDCVSLMDGHKVLKTLQNINSQVDDGPKDEITTQVWAFTRQDAQLSKDFIQGTQDFSDASFIRSVDFSKPQEAEQLVNSFVEKTSDGKVRSIFSDINPSSDLLFLTSFHFQGNWTKAFQPEKTSLQEFHMDERTITMVPMMTHTGQYHYLNDKVRRCTVVKMPLSKWSYMLLVLPHEGTNILDLEPKLRTDVMSDWHQSLQEGLLELSLPNFSMSSDTNLRTLLANMAPEVEAKLLGSQAEFSQLSNSKHFTIDKAVSKVLFEMSAEEVGPHEGAELQDKVQEEGIPLKLSINRPFLFSVIEGNSNAILILGKITTL